MTDQPSLRGLSRSRRDSVPRVGGSSVARQPPRQHRRPSCRWRPNRRVPHSTLPGHGPPGPIHPRYAHLPDGSWGQGLVRPRPAGCLRQPAQPFAFGDPRRLDGHVAVGVAQAHRPPLAHRHYLQRPVHVAARPPRFGALHPDQGEHLPTTPCPQACDAAASLALACPRAPPQVLHRMLLAPQDYRFRWCLLLGRLLLPAASSCGACGEEAWAPRLRERRSLLRWVSRQSQPQACAGAVWASARPPRWRLACRLLPPQ